MKRFFFLECLYCTMLVTYLVLYAQLEGSQGSHGALNLFEFCSNEIKINWLIFARLHLCNFKLRRNLFPDRLDAVIELLKLFESSLGVHTGRVISDTHVEVVTCRGLRFGRVLPTGWPGRPRCRWGGKFGAWLCRRLRSACCKALIES